MDKSLKAASEVQVSVSSSPMSKEDFAYNSLKEAILSGKLGSGETLNQSQIAKSLNISQIPLRGAVRRLIAEGLITQEPHFPPKVSTMSSDGLEEILLIRMHLETLAIQEAAPYLTDEVISELQSMVEDMDQAIINNDMPAFSSLNKMFHLRIYKLCPHPLLIQLITDLWDKSDRYRSRMMFVEVPGLAEQSQADHYKLMEYLSSGRIAEAVALMQDHKTNARSRYIHAIRSSNK